MAKKLPKPVGRGARRGEPKGGRGERDRSGSAAGSDMLFGHHAVQAALGNPNRRHRRLLATRNAAGAVEAAARAAGVPVEIAEPDAIERFTGADAVHQGLLLECLPLPEPAVEDLLEADGALVVLDQISDPHNVGAILRSAAAFGVVGVVMQDRRSPPLAGALAKAASGAVDIVPVARVTNLARALQAIGDAGIWRLGLDGAADEPIAAIGRFDRLALVMGAEGDGLRRLTREHCDQMVRIPMSGRIESLNVSNAAAIALYALFTARQGG